MLDFEQFTKAVEIRDSILNFDKPENLEPFISKIIEDFRKNKTSEKDILEFVKHLNSLFLTFLIAEGQDHGETLNNVRKAREILKKLETELNLNLKKK